MIFIFNMNYKLDSINPINRKSDMVFWSKHLGSTCKVRTVVVLSHGNDSTMADIEDKQFYT